MKNLSKDSFLCERHRGTVSGGLRFNSPITPPHPHISPTTAPEKFAGVTLTIQIIAAGAGALSPGGARRSACPGVLEPHQSPARRCRPAPRTIRDPGAVPSPARDRTAGSAVAPFARARTRRRIRRRSSHQVAVCRVDTARAPRASCPPPALGRRAALHAIERFVDRERVVTKPAREARVFTSSRMSHQSPSSNRWPVARGLVREPAESRVCRQRPRFGLTVSAALGTVPHANVRSHGIPGGLALPLAPWLGPRRGGRYVLPDSEPEIENPAGSTRARLGQARC